MKMSLKHFTPIPTQKCKWVPANDLIGETDQKCLEGWWGVGGVVGLPEMD